MNTVTGLTQRVIYTLQEWRGEIGFSVNTNKTDLVVFQRKMGLAGLSEHQVFGAALHCF